MAIKMEYGDDHADAKSSATGFQDLSDLAGLICTSAGDMDADSTWRATVLS